MIKYNKKFTGEIYDFTADTLRSYRRRVGVDEQGGGGAFHFTAVAYQRDKGLRKRDRDKNFPAYEPRSDIN